MRRDSLLATVTLSCLLVAGSFSLANIGPSFVNPVSGQVAGIQTSEVTSTSTDTDGDGLADATEADVYGTDSAKADTDGDGYPDGLEVRYGYSPLGLGKLTAQATDAQSADLSIVRVAGDKNVYLRNGLTVSRIANPKTLNQLGTFVSSKQVVGQAELNELQPAPVVTEGAVEELRPITLPRLPALDLTVSLASSTPASQTLPDGTMLNHVFTVRAAASIRAVVVTGLVVNVHTSSSLPSSTAVDGVSVWMDGARRGTAQLALGQSSALVTLANPIVVPARQTRTISIAADLPSDDTPGTAFYLSFDSAADIHVAANRRVRGTYPVAGNWMWVVDGSTTIGVLGVSTLAVDGYTAEPSSSTLPNVTVGSQPTVDFVRTRLAENSSHEDLGLRELRYTIEGTVNPATDLADFELLFGSMPVMTVPHVTGRTLAFSLNDWPIPAGSIRNFSVRARVVAGAGHWFRFALQDYRDIVTRGLTTGATPRPNVAVPWEPLGSVGGYWVIGEAQGDAALQVMRSPIFGQSQTVAPGASNAVLGVYTLTNVAAEPVYLTSFHLDLSTTTPWVSNLVLYAAISSGTTSTLPFTNVVSYASSSLYFDPNQEVWLAPGASLDVELRGDVSGAAPDGYLFTSYVPAYGIGALGPNDQFGIGTIHDGPTQPVTGHNVAVARDGATLTFTADPAYTYSRIIMASSTGNVVHRADVRATGDTILIDRVTYQLEGTLGGPANLGGFSSVLNLDLYHDETQLLVSNVALTNVGTYTADAVFTLATPLSVPNDSSLNLMLKADMLPAATAVEATQFRVKVKSDLPDDLIARGSGGQQLTPDQIDLPNDRVVSSWYLNHDAAPAIAAVNIPNHRQPNANDEVGRFTVTNRGPIQLALEHLTVTVQAGGLTAHPSGTTSTIDRVTNFRLYAVPADQLIYVANANVALTLSPTQLAGTVTFSGQNDVGELWDNTYRFIEAMQSRTFVIVADTSAIRASQQGSDFGQVRMVVTRIEGTRGHVEPNATSELDWADGHAGYAYTPSPFSQLSGFNASDSYPVNGIGIFYE